MSQKSRGTVETWRAQSFRVSFDHSSYVHTPCIVVVVVLLLLVLVEGAVVVVVVPSFFSPSKYSNVVPVRLMAISCWEDFLSEYLSSYFLFLFFLFDLI